MSYSTTSRVHSTIGRKYGICSLEWSWRSALPYAERQHNAVFRRYRGCLELCRDAEALEVEAGSPVCGGALVSGVVEADRGDIAKVVEGEHSVGGIELEAVGC